MGVSAERRNREAGALSVVPDKLRPVTDHERTAIRLAAAYYRYPAQREAHAMEQLDLAPTRYWALVGRLLDRADVEAEMPVEVRRLRRLRDARKRLRTAQT